MTHFAVKRLTRSDLTFFEYQFRRQNAGNQKSINLNADVFIDDIFPYARTIAAGQPHQFPVRLQILGPGLRRTPDNKTRKVIAAGGRRASRWCSSRRQRPMTRACLPTCRSFSALGAWRSCRRTCWGRCRRRAAIAHLGSDRQLVLRRQCARQSCCEGMNRADFISCHTRSTIAE